MIRVAILGAGIGAAHLKSYRQLPDLFRVAAMCDLDVERARQVVGESSDISIVSDLARIRDDPEIDVADICLPPHLHVPVAIEMLQAGKHVICEKPIARSLLECDRIEALIRETGNQFFPVFQYRYGPAFEQLKALMDAGLAGRPLVASLETHWNREADYYQIPWRGTLAGEAGGAVLCHAIHIHDLLTHIMGPIAELHAFVDTRVNAIETEDCAALSMRLENGALATSSITLGAADNTSRLKFCFEGLAPGQFVIAVTAIQRVVSIAAIQLVAAFVAIQRIPAIAAL